MTVARDSDILDGEGNEVQSEIAEEDTDFADVKRYVR